MVQPRDQSWTGGSPCSLSHDQSLTPTHSPPGLDLHGNTYWEFRDTARGDGEGVRWRRIVQYPRSVHYGDVRVSPQWHQWLRHTRHAPPSLEEQRHEVLRQERMKLLAAEADARWAAKPSLVGTPGQERGQPAPMLETERPAAGSPGAAAAEAEGGVAGAEDGAGRGEASRDPTQAPAEDPWKRHRGGPGEEWQPQAWKPSSSPKR